MILKELDMKCKSLKRLTLLQILKVFIARIIRIPNNKDTVVKTHYQTTFSRKLQTTHKSHSSLIINCIRKIRIQADQKTNLKSYLIEIPINIYII